MIQKFISNLFFQTSNSPVRYFIHIPKTAGTSFRHSLEKSFNVFSDYTLNQKITSPLIRKYNYEHKDPFETIHRLRKYKNPIISGHMPASKYSHLVGLENCVTILRNPVDRMVSHYKHQVRHKNCLDNFEDFIKLKSNINRMSKLISLQELYAIGIVGLTEHYEDTLKLVNESWTVNIRESELNVAPLKVDNVLHDNVDFSAFEDKIKLLNKNDMNLYESAIRIFNNSLYFRGMGVPDRRAFFKYNKNNSLLIGWGFKVFDSGLLTLKVSINGEKEHVCQCSIYRASLKSDGFPREGYIGFNIEERLNEGDEVKLIDLETNILLFSETIQCQ